MSMQEQVLSAIEKVVKDRGYVCRKDATWSNVGDVRISEPNTFSTTLGFSYDFQSSWQSFTINIYEGNNKIVGGMVPDTTPGLLSRRLINYHETAKIDSLIKFIGDKLPQLSPPKKKPQKKTKRRTPLRSKVHALVEGYIETNQCGLRDAIEDILLELAHESVPFDVDIEEALKNALNEFERQTDAAVG